MEVIVYTRTYNTFGGSAIFSFVGDQLMVQLGEYGGAVNSIEITAYLRSPTRNPLPTLEGIFDRYHEYLKSLPKITFWRKLKRVEIGFLSDSFTVTDKEGWHPSVEKSFVAAREVSEVLPLLKKRVKPDDDFETARFLMEASEALSRKPSSLDEWEKIGERAKQKRQALYAAKSPWEQLGIDWSQFHPLAREILDDPIYWDCASDLAPHGNDTGADLLADYRRWDKRHGNESPRRFLEGLFKGWDITPIDWSITNESDVQQLGKEQPIPLRVCNEAAIALAFAAIKMRASCPADVVDLATGALKRTAILVKASTLSNEIKAAWDVAIEKMKAKLDSVPR